MTICVYDLKIALLLTAKAEPKYGNYASAKNKGL